MRCFALATVAVLLLNSRAMARNYYVATNGADGNLGTLDQPFQTIQKAASVVVAGDTVHVREGTYRETVTPARSGTQMAPITFQPYNGESVTISGADLIPASAWTLSGGSIWQATVSWDLGEGNNQVFLDGKMMIEARWPNTTLDVSHPSCGPLGGRIVRRGHARLYCHDQRPRTALTARRLLEGGNDSLQPPERQRFRS
jgi:hypothetical protein